MRDLEAALSARDNLEQAKGIDLGLRPYKCGNHWHLGHKRKDRLRKRILGRNR